MVNKVGRFCLPIKSAQQKSVVCRSIKSFYSLR